MKRIKTTWQMRTYDVWGNKRDGFDVNDSFNRGEYELNLKVTVYNEGKSGEFVGAYPSIGQIQNLFGTRSRLSICGDDLNIYVNRERDGYPIGELFCLSHESLSPIREKQDKE